jgi:hypothetical protein
MNFFDPDRLDPKKFKQLDGERKEGEPGDAGADVEQQLDANATSPSTQPPPNEQPEFPLPEWAQQKEEGETPPLVPGDIDPETGQRVSMSEGVSYAPLIPFFILLLALMLSAFVVIMVKSPPASYDPTKYGPPDMTLEECVSGFFHDARNTTGTATQQYFLGGVEVMQMRLHETSPFNRPAMDRYNTAVQMVVSSDFTRITPHPQQPEPDAVTARLEYERRDMQTGVIRDEILWLARAPAGWRIGGFE